jgi:hypothetical protein
MSFNKKYVLQIVAGFLILLAIILKFSGDLHRLSDVKFNMAFFALSLIPYTFLNLILSFRLYFLLHKMGCNTAYPRIFLAHLSGMLVGDATPGRSGYLMTPKFVESVSGCSIQTGTAAIISPQGIEFLIKVIGALLAIVYLVLPVSGSAMYSALFGTVFVFFLAVALIWFAWKSEFRILGKLPFISNYVPQFHEFRDKSLVVKENVAEVTLISLAGWVFAALQWQLIGLSLGLKLSFLDYFLLHPLLTALSFVPITPAGLGLVESGGVVVFYLMGLDPLSGFAFTLLARLSNVIGDFPGIALIFRRVEQLESK